MNHRAKYLGQMSFRLKVIVRINRHTHTRQADYSIWTTKVVSNEGGCLADIDDGLDWRNRAYVAGRTGAPH